jgi:hypothetical protein
LSEVIQIAHGFAALVSQKCPKARTAQQQEENDGHTRGASRLP